MKSHSRDSFVKQNRPRSSFHGLGAVLMLELLLVAGAGCSKSSPPPAKNQSRNQIGQHDDRHERPRDDLDLSILDRKLETPAQDSGLTAVQAKSGFQSENPDTQRAGVLTATAATRPSLDPNNSDVEIAPPEWVALSFPATINRSQEWDNKSWSFYLMDLNVRKDGKAISPHDAEIYKYLLGEDFLKERLGDLAYFRSTVELGVSASLFMFEGTNYQEEMIPIARRLLKNDSKYVRGFAAYALGHFGDSESLQEIKRALRSADAETRPLIIKSLQRLGYEPTAEDQKVDD